MKKPAAKNTSARPGSGLMKTIHVRLARSGGFNRSDLNEVERLVTENETVLREAWNEYFGA